MHPFGGTPICPRCSKAVYAAEQIMGPGRKLYHKPCLACASCGKRLDSYSLVEHDQEPYCKQCHVKTFGTRDLRHANLPDRDDVLGFSPPTSPGRSSSALPSLPTRPSPSASSTTPGITPTTAPSLPFRRTTPSASVSSPTTGFARTTSPRLQATRTLSPSNTTPLSPSPALPARRENVSTPSTGKAEEGPVRAPSPWEDEPSDRASVSATTPVSMAKRPPQDGIPRTVPLSTVISPSPTKHALPPRTTPSNGHGAPGNGTGSSAGSTPRSSLDAHRPTATTPRSRTSTSSPSKPSQTPIRTIPLPLAPTSTGIRYGAALGGARGTPGSPTGGRFGGLGGNPTCAKCGKVVYFAEQVKALNKTYHKPCLRCSDCNTLLDSSRLTEKEGDPFCNRCYSKLFGPAGSGYALLGKSGA